MNKTFHTTNRLVASSIRFPRVAQTGPQTLQVMPKGHIMKVTSLQCMPSKSTCEDMLKTLRLGKYSAVSCNLGTFDIPSLEAIRNVHGLWEVANNVQKERAWLAKTVVPPNEKCSFSKSDMVSFRNLIWNNPDGHAVLDYDRSLLASDLALLSGTQWLNFSVLATTAKILQSEGSETAVLMFNELLQMDGKSIRQVIRECGRNTKYVTFFVNVGKAVEVFFGNPNRPGNHWTLLYIDLTTNQWYYCDPYGWGTPKNIKAALLSIVATFYEEISLKPRPFKGCMQGSAPSGSHHIGSLKNLPIQTCANVCGVTAAILGGIASAAPILWPVP